MSSIPEHRIGEQTKMGKWKWSLQVSLLPAYSSQLRFHTIFRKKTHNLILRVLHSRLSVIMDIWVIGESQNYQMKEIQHSREVYKGNCINHSSYRLVSDELHFKCKTISGSNSDHFDVSSHWNISDIACIQCEHWVIQ